MAVSTTSTEAELIAEYWNNVFLNELRENLAFYDYGLRATHGRGQGTMVHWLSLADLTAAASLTEGTDPTETTLSAGDLTATVTQYGASVLVSDILQETWVAGSYQQLMERLARNAAFTLDTVIRDTILTAGGSAQLGGTAVSRNSIASDGSFDADLTEIRQAVNSLEVLKVPTYPDGFYVGIVAPDVKYDLQADTANWTEILQSQRRDDYSYTGMAPGRGGIVGTMFGVKFIMSQLAGDIGGALSFSGSACTDIYQSFIFGPEYFGVSELQNVQTIVKNPHPASDLDLYGTVGWKCSFASKELNSKRMTRLETGASLGT